MYALVARSHCFNIVIRGCNKCHCTFIRLYVVNGFSKQLLCQRALSTSRPKDIKSLDDYGILFKPKKNIDRYYCDLCDIQCTSSRDLKQHQSGTKHQNNLQQQMLCMESNDDTSNKLEIIEEKEMETKSIIHSSRQREKKQIISEGIEKKSNTTKGKNIEAVSVAHAPQQRGGEQKGSLNMESNKSTKGVYEILNKLKQNKGIMDSDKDNNKNMQKLNKTMNLMNTESMETSLKSQLETVQNEQSIDDNEHKEMMDIFECVDDLDQENNVDEQNTIDIINDGDGNITIEVVSPSKRQ